MSGRGEKKFLVSTHGSEKNKGERTGVAGEEEEEGTGFMRDGRGDEEE